MNYQESMESQQAKQRKDQELLRSERQARGESRNAHLETGREQARNDNAQARAGSNSMPAPDEDTRDDMSDDEYEAQLRVRGEADRAAMKSEESALRLELKHLRRGL